MSDDRPDPRIRELTYQLMGMAPDAPPFPEEATVMTVPTKQRSPMLVWAAAAAVVVLLVGLPLFLFRGGDTAPDDDVAIATSTSTVDTPTTTISEVPTTVPEPGSVELTAVYSVYYFSETNRTAVGEPALVPVQLEHVLSVDGSDLDQRVDDSLSAAASALELLLRSPTPAGHTTAIPDGLFERGGSLEGSVFTVDLPSGFEAGGGTMSMTSRLAQVVYTVTQFPEIDSVLFSIEDEIVDVFSSEGLILDGPQTRADYYDILPFIFLDTPAIGSTVASPVRIAGIANVFEATVLYEVVDGRGSVLADGFTTATCGTGCWGDFAIDVGFQVRVQTFGEIVVYEESARDGSRINELRFPVSLIPGGSVPTTTEPPVTATTLPGEAFDIGPQAGDVMGVVGVAYDDVLNVREAPGTGYNIVTTLGPLADNVVATGRHRLLTSSIWTEVTGNGATGWVSSSFVAFLGGVNDVTAATIASLGGVPEADTMDTLSRMVAGPYASSEPGQRLVVSVAPTVGDLAEITIEIVGLADDSVFGVRLHIFAEPTETGFSLKSVEQTSLCGRGVTAEGLCV